QVDPRIAQSMLHNAQSNAQRRSVNLMSVASRRLLLFMRLGKIATGAGRDAHAINTGQPKMDRSLEKNSGPSTPPGNPAPSLSSAPNVAQGAAPAPVNPVAEPAATANATPANNLRKEIRIWSRDLLIAIGLALVIIVFLYQPVKVEGTSMAPLLSDQERIFINKFVYRFEPIQRGDV